MCWILGELKQVRNISLHLNRSEFTITHYIVKKQKSVSESFVFHGMRIRGYRYGAKRNGDATPLIPVIANQSDIAVELTRISRILEHRIVVELRPMDILCYANQRNMGNNYQQAQTSQWWVLVAMKVQKNVECTFVRLYPAYSSKITRSRMSPIKKSNKNSLGSRYKGFLPRFVRFS